MYHGTARGEPSSSVALNVSNGLFTVMLGDKSLAGMIQPITQYAFAQTATYLRVWFSQTAGGPFQALDPNQRIGSAAYALRAELPSEGPRGLNGRDGAGRGELQPVRGAISGRGIVLLGVSQFSLVYLDSRKEDP